jgi:CubicO group peptidase (beta-lactamase class C family)
MRSRGMVSCLIEGASCVHVSRLTAPLGEQFQYSNQMFGIGGYAAAAASAPGETDLFAAYDMAMRQRILDPLGMTDSTSSSWSTSYGSRSVGVGTRRSQAGSL